LPFVTNKYGEIYSKKNLSTTIICPINRQVYELKAPATLPD